MATFSDKGSLPAALSLVSSSPPRLTVPLTQQQEHALYILNDEDDRDICAYIRFSASTGSGPQSSSDHASLPKEKVHAIEALKSLPVNVLLARLQATRYSGERNSTVPITPVRLLTTPCRKCVCGFTRSCTHLRTLVKLRRLKT